MNLNNIDLNKLSVFCQVLESRNYRLASEILHVTPSAISQTIAILEESLGFPLFHRHGRKLIPTDNGRRIHAEFRRHHGGFLAALEDLASKQEKVAGTLRIGAYLEFAKSQLAPVIRSFSQKHREAQLKITFDMPSRLHRSLEQGQIDICFSIYPSVERKKVESSPVYHDELVLVSPPGLLPDNPSFREIMAAPLMEYYVNHQPMLRWIQLHFRKRPRQLPVRVYASTAEMVLALVEEGAGIGVVPKFLLDSAHPKRAVKIVRPSNRKLLDHIWVLENKTKHSSLHEEFKREVLAHLRSTP